MLPAIAIAGADQEDLVEAADERLIGGRDRLIAELRRGSRAERSRRRRRRRRRRTPAGPAAAASASLASTRAWKTAPSAATPVAIPTWRKVLLMPDAMPARAGSTTPIATEAMPGLVIPIPVPPTRNPTSSVVQSSPRSMPVHQHEADPDQQQPGAHQRPERDPVRQPGRDRRDDEREQRQRQEPQPGLERRVARGRPACRGSGRGTSRTSPPRGRRRRSRRR